MVVSRYKSDRVEHELDCFEVERVADTDHFRVGFFERPQSNEPSNFLRVGQASQGALLVEMAELCHNVLSNVLVNAFDIDSDIEIRRNRDHGEPVNVRYAVVNLRQTVCDDGPLLAVD